MLEKAHARKYLFRMDIYYKRLNVFYVLIVKQAKSLIPSIFYLYRII